jgi:hypothetical protein
MGACCSGADAHAPSAYAAELQALKHPNRPSSLKLFSSPQQREPSRSSSRAIDTIMQHAAASAKKRSSLNLNAKTRSKRSSLSTNLQLLNEHQKQQQPLTENKQSKPSPQHARSPSPFQHNNSNNARRCSSPSPTAAARKAVARSFELHDDSNSASTLTPVLCVGECGF